MAQNSSRSNNHNHNNNNKMVWGPVHMYPANFTTDPDILNLLSRVEKINLQRIRQRVGRVNLNTFECDDIAIGYHRMRVDRQIRFDYATLYV